MKRKLLAWVLLAVTAQVHAQIEKRDVHIAVGGKTALYYLPLTLTERLGLFKDEGLNVRISDFPGGTRSLEAVVGGSADVVSGAYEHTINMQARKQNFQAFVLAGAADQRRHRRSAGGGLPLAEGPQGAQGRRERAGLQHEHGDQLSARAGRA